ncbi:MAG: hypothetical protein AB7K14_07085 [Lysobacterales bacterium]
MVKALSAYARQILIVMLIAWTSAAPAQPGGDPALGQRLYEHGINRLGEPIRTAGDVVYIGEQAACMRCHRRSGFGGSEGGYYVPPITSEFLFAPTRNDRNDRFRAAFLEAQSVQHWIRARMPRSRPAYTVDTLATALREGRNPSQTPFEQLMPRFELDDEDVANLYAYLQGLSKFTSPGVDEDFLHIATVVGPGVDPGERDAMLRTSEGYLSWYNERLKGDLSHQASTRAYGMQFRSSTRLWKMHVWNLHGPPSTWSTQLQDYQSKQPVFLIANGMVQGSWAPVASFCNSERMPCLLPLTDLPPSQSELGGYNIYYTRGLEFEADLLALYLSELKTSPKRLLQLHDGSEYGVIPANRFSAAAIEQLPGIELLTVHVRDDRDLEEAFRRISRETTEEWAVVAWPGQYLGKIAKNIKGRKLQRLTVYTSSRIVTDEAHGVGNLTVPELAERVRIIWPYSSPDTYHPDAFRVRGWMRSRGLAVSHERIQFMSYYSLGILRDSMRHMFDHFHRDYLIERIEHEVEGAANPGFFPTLSLGPEQRVLSKGGVCTAGEQSIGRTQALPGQRLAATLRLLDRSFGVWPSRPRHASGRFERWPTSMNAARLLLAIPTSNGDDLGSCGHA